MNNRNAGVLRMVQVALLTALVVVLQFMGSFIKIGPLPMSFVLVPIVIGAVNDATGSYVAPMIIFSSFGVAALFIGMLLKIEDKKKGYGLELPNIKK